LDFKKEWLDGFEDKSSKQYQVAQVLSDTQWHCRGHEYSDINSTQLAGGGGIQGLERGTKSREGLVLEAKTEECSVCNEKMRLDRWTGEYKKAITPSGISSELVKRILAYYDHTDVIEKRERPQHELVVDHRFPMLRWGDVEDSNDPAMSEDEIKNKFQLLKFDGGGNHNLLKSRDCERCLNEGRRGTPFGINFFYTGDENWPKEVPPKGKNAEQGCVGCGWYNFAEWRTDLNKKLNSNK